MLQYQEKGEGTCELKKLTNNAVKGDAVKSPFKMFVTGKCVKKTCDKSKSKDCDKEKDKYVTKKLTFVKSNLSKCTLEFEYSGKSACGTDLVTLLAARFSSILTLIYGKAGGGILMTCSGLLILLFDY